MRLSNKIVLASLNPEKLEEFSNLFKPYPEIEIVSASGIIRNAEKLSLVENYDTYLENAIAKARLGNAGSHYPTLADDTGLEVEALGGKPGVRSHRYAKPPYQGAWSRLEQDKANNELLLKELKSASGSKNARFVTTLALVIEGILVHATGVLEGTLIDTPRGENGFGYDPLFVPNGSQKTLAEMTQGEKNQVSHRAKAVGNLMAEIKARGVVFAKP